jgi:hypothetical protein
MDTLSQLTCNMNSYLVLHFPMVSVWLASSCSIVTLAYVDNIIHLLFAVK